MHFIDDTTAFVPANVACVRSGSLTLNERGHAAYITFHPCNNMTPKRTKSVTKRSNWAITLTKRNYSHSFILIVPS